MLGPIDAGKPLQFGMRHERSTSDFDELQLAGLNQLVERCSSYAQRVAGLVDAVCQLARGRRRIQFNDIGVHVAPSVGLDGSHLFERTPQTVAARAAQPDFAGFAGFAGPIG